MPDNKRELMQYRLEMAEERLRSSKVLLETGNYKDSIGRSYYAMFSGVRALLAVEGQDFSKHTGVISYFQREYIKTGKFDKRFSKYISQAFQIRNNTDYSFRGKRALKTETQSQSPPPPEARKPDAGS